MEDAHQDIGGAGRVGQWAQDIEDGAHAQFFAHGRHVFHGRVVVGRKHEANALLFQALGDLCRLEVDIHTQGFQHIGAAALAADASAPVLADLGAGGCGHKHAAGGDVEGVAAVAAGAHNVHQMGFVLHFHLGGEFAHHPRGGGDFTNGFLLDTQPRDDGRHHHRRHLARHDLAHQVQHLVVEDFAVLNRALQRFLRGNFDGIGHCLLLKLWALRSAPI